jgi:glycosyltransferase involved in cell wall biosynthesis
MRLVLASNFPRDEKLGSARVPLRLANELGRRGVAVTLLFAGDLPPGPRGRGNYVTAPFRMAAALARRAADADVVEIAGYDGWVYSRFARRLRPQQITVARSHGLWEYGLATFEPPEARAQRAPAQRLLSDLYQRRVLMGYERASIVDSDLAVFASRGDADEAVRQRWKTRAEVAAVNHGVDEFFGSDVALEARRDVAVIGTFFYRKGSDIIGRAMSGALRARPALGLTLFGPGQSVEEARALFDADVRERVTVVGALPAAELARRLASYAIFLFPSRYEAFGIVVPEAMRAGLAVVTTPTGAGLDVVRDGENGLLVPIGSVAAAQAAVLRLVDDPALRARLGARAAADAAALTWARAAQELEAAYEGALERVARGGRS